MVKKANKPVSFILSTGRTGTQFFSSYLTETCEGVLCLHEPFPSRRFKWYSNFYLKGKLSKEFIGKQYLAKRKKIFNNHEITHYVESSNFLFGCVEPINEFIDNLSVIHIVRHPISYTISHLNKGFWSGIKGFTARYIPGWLEFIDKETKATNDPVLILLTRWIYVNKVIASYQQKNPYLLLRFEDVFDKNAEDPMGELNNTRKFLGCDELQNNEQEIWLKKTANKSRKNRAKDWPFQQQHIDFIKSEGAGLLEKFDYSILENHSNS